MVNAAQEALNGVKSFIQFGEWSDVKEDMSLEFEGISLASSCWVENRDGECDDNRRITGKTTTTFRIGSGETVKVMSAWITFSPLSG